MVKYSLRKVLKPYIQDRESLLVKCTPVTMNIAKNLLNHGYKQMSKFGRWCPVKVSYIIPSCIIVMLCTIAC